MKWVGKFQTAITSGINKDEWAYHEFHKNLIVLDLNYADGMLAFRGPEPYNLQGGKS